MSDQAEPHKEFMLLTDIPGSFTIEEADRLSDDQMKSFRDPTEIKVGLMKTGDILWRFAHGSQNNKKLFSDCWMDRKTMQATMSIFRSWGDYSDEAKKGVVHKNFAVLKDWFNDIKINGKPVKPDMVLAWRVKISIKEEVVAYYGETGPQHTKIEATEIFKNEHEFINHHIEYRVGGMPQYIIPRFKRLANENQQAEVVHLAKL
jgi:hypothetical protein